MRSQRRLLATVALPLAVIVACTRPQSTDDSVAPLAPPDTLSEPTTTRPPPTTVPDVERTTIVQVDPLTLEPLDGFEPMPMGDWSDWYWSDTSDNGRWLAMTTYDERSGSAELRLIDLAAWEIIESWTIAEGGPLQVGDDGSTYLLGGSELLIYAPSPGGMRTAIDLPPSFASWSPIDLYEGHVRMFGSRQLGTLGADAEILDVDLSTGEVTSIALPRVGLGDIAHIEITGSEGATVNVNPALIWSHPQRALLVHASEDLVTEVDLATGSVVEHRFGPAELPVAEEPGKSWSRLDAYVSSSRSAALSPNGDMLYVATQSGDLEITDNGWQTTSTPTGLIAIDTTTWSVADELDILVSNITMSPLGDRLLATGYTDTQTFDTEAQEYGTYEYGSTGFYLLDSTLDVISETQPEDPTQTSYGPVSFGPDGGLGYLTTWEQTSQIDVFDLENGAVLNTTQGVYEDVWILGPIGVLGQVDQSG